MPNQAAPQQFQQPRGDAPRGPLAQVFNRPQPPPTLRPQPPASQQAPIPGAQPIRLPPNQLPLQQRLPLSRPPIQQHPNQPIQSNGHPQQFRAGVPSPAQGPQFSAPHPSSDANQGVRLNLGQYRPIQPQPDLQRAPLQPQQHINKPPQQLQQPIQSQNPALQNPIRRPSTQDRFKMATEVNQAGDHPPSYIISNSDDVDDVIVRPITQSTVLKADLEHQNSQPKVQPQLPQPPPAAQIIQPEIRQPPIQAPPKQPPPESQLPRSVLQSSGPEPAARAPAPANGPPPQARPPPQPVAKQPAEQPKKQNGTNGRAEVSMIRIH